MLSTLIGIGNLEMIGIDFSPWGIYSLEGRKEFNPTIVTHSNRFYYVGLDELWSNYGNSTEIRWKAECVCQAVEGQW